MCGIAGIVSLSGRSVDPSLLARMGQCLHHRGPDEDGNLIEPGVGLAIKRLKVIDLVTGHQPMFNETKDVATVFNGEIFNYKTLRTELELKGHTFTSHSDTETIVHLYEEYGDDFPARLNGMFAIALWDRKKQKLILARDPAGIKPLFYALQSDALYFGSEIKSLLDCPGVSRVVDSQAFYDYLSFYYVSAPRTIYKDVRRLEAGQMLIAVDGTVRVKKYWDVNFRPSAARSFADTKKEFLDILDRSVQRHLQSDVPLGVFLSGGLDSASLVAVMSRHVSNIQTYSVGYAEQSYSELSEAKSIANRFHTQHHEVVMTARDMIDLLPTVVTQLDEPHGDWSAVPNYLLARQAKRDVTVILNGAGGDELFGGYPTLIAARFAEIYRRCPAWLRKNVIEKAAALLPTSHERMAFDFLVKSFVRGADYPAEEAHRRFKEIFDEGQRSRLLTPDARAALSASSPANVFESYRSSFQPFETIDRLQYLDFKVFLAQSPLYVSDMTSSAHAVEMRVPFLDREMIEFAASIPWRWKIRGLTTKYIMREAMTGALPAHVTKMKKKGFLIPGAVWIKKDLRPVILDIIASARTELSWLFDFGYIDRLLEDHFSERADNTRRISCLVSFFLWHKAAAPTWDRDAVGVNGA